MAIKVLPPRGITPEEQEYIYARMAPFKPEMDAIVTWFGGPRDANGDWPARSAYVGTLLAMYVVEHGRLPPGAQRDCLALMKQQSDALAAAIDQDSELHREAFAAFLDGYQLEHDELPRGSMDVTVYYESYFRRFGEVDFDKLRST